MSKHDVSNEELLVFVFAIQWILCQIIRSILKAWKINTKGLNENPKEKKIHILEEIYFDLLWLTKKKKKYKIVLKILGKKRMV